MTKPVLHLIAAARPNFMKVAPLWHALEAAGAFDARIVHTGQHYDANMSDAFFADLRLPEPHFHLGVGSGSHAEQTARVMMGYEKLCVEHRPDWTIVVGDVNSVSVAEHAMMLLLAAAKRAVRADRSVRVGDWSWRNRLESVELSGKNLLIVGYGRIGRHLARMAAGFGMDIRAHDPFLEKSGWPEGTVAAAADLKAALAWADAVSIHVPKGEHATIGAEELSVMKRSAIIVNTARGGAVDEGSLAEALREGRIAAAGLDVFEDEPPRPGDPLLGLDQAVLSPHDAALTRECAERMAVSSVQNVLDFFDERMDPALIVNGSHLNCR